MAFVNVNWQSRHERHMNDYMNVHLLPVRWDLFISEAGTVHIGSTEVSGRKTAYCRRNIRNGQFVYRGNEHQITCAACYAAIKAYYAQFMTVVQWQ